MPLQDLNYKTSVFTGTKSKESIGEGLAKFVSQAISATTTVLNEKRKNEERDRVLRERAKNENLDADSLLYIEEKAGLERAKTDANFSSLNGQEQEEFIRQYYQENQTEYSTDKYKAQSSLYMDNELSNAQKIRQNDYVNMVKNEAIPTIAKENKILTMDDVDFYSKAFAESGIKNSKNLILNELSKSISFDISSREQEFLNNRMSAEDIKKQFPILNDIKDNRITKQINDRLEVISKEVDKLNYSDSITDFITKSYSDDTLTISNLYTESNKKYNKTYSDVVKDVNDRAKGFVNAMVIQPDKASRVIGIQTANKYNIDIGVYDKDLENIGNLSLISPAKAKQAYDSISLASNEGYSFNNKDLENYLALDFALTVTGSDKQNLTENDFAVASELIKNRKVAGYKAISSYEFYKKIEEDYDGDYTDAQQKSLFNKVRLYSRFYNRDEAFGMAIKELEMKPLMKYKDVEVDASDTGFKTEKDIKEFMDFRRQDFPNVDIDNLRRNGNIFNLVDSDGNIVSDPFTAKSIESYMKKKRAKNKEEQDNLEITSKNIMKLDKEAINLYESIKKPEEAKSTQEASVYNASRIGAFGLALKNGFEDVSNAVVSGAKSITESVSDIWNGADSFSSTVLTKREFENAKRILDIEVKKNPDIIKPLDKMMQTSDLQKIKLYLNGLPIDEKSNIIIGE